jgi:hypothetical protein
MKIMDAMIIAREPLLEPVIAPLYNPPEFDPSPELPYNLEIWESLDDFSVNEAINEAINEPPSNEVGEPSDDEGCSYWEDDDGVKKEDTGDDDTGDDYTCENDTCESKNCRTWIGIDVGVINLGFVKAHVHMETNVVKIVETHCIDLTQLKHEVVPLKECKLWHSKDMFDRIQHLLQEYGDFLKDSDLILIERQPIVGLVHVEQLIYGAFRDKAILVSPNSMHKWMNINTLDYDQRKVKTVEKAEPYMSHFSLWHAKERKHDMADAVCLILFHCHKEYEKHEEEQRQLARNQNFQAYNGEGLEEFFQRFRYVPSS